MRTKNARSITTAEREHLARVKSLPCSVCDEPGPSDALAVTIQRLVA